MSEGPKQPNIQAIENGIDPKRAQLRRLLATGTDWKAQRRSVAIGEIMLSHPEMTRAEAETLVDQVLAEVERRK